MWIKGNPSSLLVRMQTGAATMENSMEFPQKSKMELPFDPAIGNIPKESPNTTLKELMHPMIHSGTTYNSQVLETA